MPTPIDPNALELELLLLILSDALIEPHQLGLPVDDFDNDFLRQTWHSD
jgi:hypothetical protein